MKNEIKDDIKKKIRYINDFENNEYHDIHFIKHLNGFLIFILFFVIIIPYLLKYYKYFEILEVYLPNIDLIATAFSYHEGPFNIWRLLFIPTPINWISFIYQTIIKYISLLGLTYIICRETKLSNNIFNGWSLGMIMLLITYLLPNQFITHFMTKFDNYLNHYENKLLFCNECKKIYNLFFGLLIIILIIIFEKYIIFNCRNYLIKICKFIISF